MATIKTRPNITLRLNPVVTWSARSNKTTNLTNLGNRAAYYVKETNTGVRRRKPSGWIDPTAYTFERDQITACVGTVQYMVAGVPASGSGSWHDGVVGTVPGDAVTRLGDIISNCNLAITDIDAKKDEGLRAVALTAARNKLKTSSVDFGVAYGERKQTMRLVGDNATRIAKAFTALKRGKTRKAMQELGISNKRREPRGKNVTDKWLEMQYGAKPLYSDVYGACDALEKRNRDDWSVTAKAMRRSVKDYGPVQSPYIYAATIMAARVERSVFVRIDATPKNEAIISLASMGVLNPLTVAWELTYASFVVDWFWPIGNWLDSLDATWGYELRGSSSSLLVRADWTVGCVPVKTSGSAKTISNFSTGTRKLVYLSRLTGVGGSIPAIPRFKDPRSWSHMANGLALLASAFGRRGKGKFLIW